MMSRAANGRIEAASSERVVRSPSGFWRWPWERPSWTWPHSA